MVSGKTDSGRRGLPLSGRPEPSRALVGSLLGVRGPVGRFRDRGCRGSAVNRGSWSTIAGGRAPRLHAVGEISQRCSPGARPLGGQYCSAQLPRLPTPTPSTSPVRAIASASRRRLEASVSTSRCWLAWLSIWLTIRGSE